MPGKLRTIASHFWSQDSGPYPLLFLLAFTLFVLGPLISARIVAPFILEIAFSLIIISGVFIVTARTSVRLLAVAVALLSIAINSLHVLSGKTTTTIEIILSVAMFAVFALLMGRNFLSRRSATAHRIAGAVTIYLLLGLIWARVYQLLESLAPGSFRFPEGEAFNNAGLTYFSFVTLATLGFGDITPVSLVARDLTVLEAIMGQLYLVILISRLVSEGVAKPGNE